MGKRGPLSAAHKAAISAGLKRYHAGRGSSGGGSGGSRRSAAPTPKARTAPVAPPKVAKASGKSGSPAAPKVNQLGAPKRPIINISTGKPISAEEAALRMFGSAGARKKKAAGKKARRR